MAENPWRPPIAILGLANVGGAHLLAQGIGNTPALRPKFHLALGQLATEAADVPFGNALLRGVFTGWLIARWLHDPDVDRERAGRRSRWSPR